MANPDDSSRQSFRDLIIVGLEKVNEDLKEMRNDHVSMDQEWRSAVSELKIAIAKLETRIAIYSGIGAILGGGAVTFLSRQIGH